MPHFNNHEIHEIHEKVPGRNEERLPLLIFRNVLA